MRRGKRSEKGFTVIELIIVVALIAIVVIGIGFLTLRCNFYYTEQGVLTQLQEEHEQSGFVKIFKSGTERNVYAYSVISVQDNEGNKYEFCLDTSVFFDYKLKKCEE